jgi:tetraacyldisaccharide 4'-kinase
MKESPGLLSILLLWPAMVIYRMIIGFRNFAYDYKMIKSKEFDMPIISIGNISVGGTGKTPHTEFILQMLKDEFKVAILSRGYKRKTKGFRLVETTDKHQFSGDEPLQIKQKFPEVIVAVCESRTVGVEKLRDMYPDLNLIILDDAFQHRKITPGLSILLNNYNHPIAKDHMLPLGRLREPRSSSHRAHIVIYSKCPSELKPIERRILSKEVELLPYQDLFFSTLKYMNLRPVFDEGNVEVKIDSIKNNSLIVLTGIARPANFIAYLESKSAVVNHFNFPDHYSFRKKDIVAVQKAFANTAEPKLIIVTEKDAVRLKSDELFDEEFKKYVYCIPIEVELLCSEEERKHFDNQIFSYVRNNKRYSKLYKNAYSG